MAVFYTNCFQRGNKIYVRGYRDGVKYYHKADFRPELFIANGKDEGDSWRGFVTNQVVNPVEFDSINEAKEFVERYKGVEGFDVFGQSNYVYQYIGRKWTREVPWESRMIDSMIIDIETATESGFPNIKTANEEILLITCKRKGKAPVTFGTRAVDKDYKLEGNYHHYASEKIMLEAFILYFSKNYPDVISGWNVEGFDIPYLCNRITNLFGEDILKQLSPFGLVYPGTTEVNGNQEPRFDIKGISILDYLPMYKKFTFKARESYKLDFICEVEIGKKKLDHSEFDTFKEFYDGDFSKFTLYNQIDCIRVEELDDKLQLLDLVYGVAYMAKINFNDCYSPIRTWEAYIYNALQAKRIAIPIEGKKHARESFEGGHVKDTLSGFYEWIVTFDLTSLYPHLIMLANISPEMIVNDNLPVNLDRLVEKDIDLSVLQERDLAMAGNGQLFRRDGVGIFPELMHELFNVRKTAKDTMKELKNAGGDKKLIASLNTKQGAVKVLLNSLFGAAGNPYFRYYDLRMAEGITKTGQLAIRWIERKVNEYLNKILKTNGVDYVVASDTDSIMVNFGPFVQAICPNKSTIEVVDFLDKICDNEFAKFIHNSFDELAYYLNAKEHSLHMKRENICDRGIFIKKKRYILNVWDSEGYRYAEPDHKVMGIQLVQSSTPAVVRAALKDSINIIMYEKESDIRAYVKDVKQRFVDEPVESIAFPRGCNDVDKWMSSATLYKKGTPIHVRAAILYNHLLRENGLTNKYPLIRNGDKMKFVYLKLPNTLHENIIGFPIELPTEFGLHKYIDYDTQFASAFVDSLEAMVAPRKWSLVQKASMAMI